MERHEAGAGRGEGGNARQFEVLKQGAVDSLQESSDEGGDSDNESEVEEREEVSNAKMPEDIYGFAATALIRDAKMINEGLGHKPLRISRLFLSQAFVWINAGLQLFLLMQVKLYVTAKHVHEIRQLYSDFELHMYGREHSIETYNGYYRGTDGFFQPERFDTLANDIKADLCRISLSQPNFFGVILLIWTLTCVGEIKATRDMFQALIWRTPTVKRMAQALKGWHLKDEDIEEVRQRNPDMAERLEGLGANERLVVGLTMSAKVYLAVLLLFPRLLITCILWFLGCRWLLATVGFENILLNAVALEFVLLLKDLLYATVVPQRSKHDVENTQILPSKKRDAVDCCSFLGAFTWFVTAVVLVWLYVFTFQKVLPDYRWDVRDVCASEIAKRFPVSLWQL